MKALYPVLLFCFLCFTSFGQKEDSGPDIANSAAMKKREKTQNNAVLINFYYSALVPVGEIRQRFGFANHIGMNISYMLQHNWIIGAEGDYMFGAHVKENQILAPLSTSTGQFIQNGGDLGDISLELSGFEAKVRVGKLFALSKKHPNSGILLTLAPGFMMHKIWIRATQDNYKQFNSDYKTGYDRMTNGPMLAGSLGYLFLERKKFLSFHVAVEYSVGFTQNRRAWNFFDATGNPGGPDKHQRYDMFLGFKIAWVIPVFTNRDSEAFTK